MVCGRAAPDGRLQDDAWTVCRRARPVSVEAGLLTRFYCAIVVKRAIAPRILSRGPYRSEKQESSMKPWHSFLAVMRS